jgi:Transcriptional regulator, AbiEi antitoxin/Protein of unknown function (DUF559)
MREERANRERILARLAAKQQGVVLLEQLRAIGSSHAIAYRVRIGRLHRIHRGVYAVGHARLTFEGRCMAAVLACGEGAVASHRATGALWGHAPAQPRPHRRHGSRLRRPQGAPRHRHTPIRPADLERHDPATRHPPCAAGSDPAGPSRHPDRGAAPEGHAARALDLRLDVAAALDPDPDLTGSELERVESDRARDARLQALGYRVLRFTHRQLRDHPRAVVATLRDVMRASGGPGPRPLAGKWDG